MNFYSHFHSYSYSLLKVFKVGMRKSARKSAFTNFMIDTQTVISALTEVTDPEMPISIVDMGMIYDVRVKGSHVEVDMTFTAIACPAMEMLISDVKEKINELPGAPSVQVNIVWNPPWTKSRLSERGRDILQSFGVAV